MDEYILKHKRKSSHNSRFYRYVFRFLVLVIITLSLLIALKGNAWFRSAFYKQVYDTHFPFAEVNKLFKDKFGNSLPFKDLFNDKTDMVFNEKLKYSVASKYYDGVCLEVGKDTIIPVLESGMVVFIGEKENYGNTVIIEQIDGIDVWYGNVTNVNVKLYDYVEKGSILGNSIENNLYLVYKQDGKNLDYEKYLQN